jgi:WD40 repeat protein
MVRDVADRPGALALLSFTASRLWELRDRHFQRMTRSAYDALGGVGGALAQHAEETLAALGDDAAAREAFRHLVTADKTRAVIERGELVELIAKGASTTAAAADKVIERLVAARLLLASEGGTGGADLVEVIHEALLVSWPRLVGWQHEDAENVRLRDQLRSAARQWDARGRPRGLLWRGDALLELRLWRARYPGALTATEDAFDRASIADENRGRRWRRAILGVALVGLAASAVTFAWLRGEAETNRRSATASAAEARTRLLDSYVETGRRALIAGDPGAATDFLERATREGVDTPAIRFMLARAKESTSADAAWLRGHDGLVWDIEFSPDATRVATASDDGTVRVWSTTGDELARIEGLPRKRVDLAWSPDGATIATAAEGNVQLWDASRGTLRGELRGHVGPVRSVAFSPDGRSIVTAAAAEGDDTIRMWDVATSTGRVIESIGDKSHNFASWSPDGRWIAIATTRLPNAMVPSAIVIHGNNGTRRELAGHAAAVWYAYVDPSGTRVASASLDRTARVWDLATGRELHVLRGHDDRVTDVTWSPDGSELATASADGTIRLWNASDGTTRVVLRGHSAQVNRVRFGVDGRLYSAGNDGLAMVWDARHGIQLAAFNHGGFVFQIDVAGTTLASASWLGTGRLWHVDNAVTARSMVGGQRSSEPRPPAIDGSRALRVRDTGVELWDLDRGESTDIAVDGIVDAVLVGGRRAVAIATRTGDLRIHDATTGTHLRDVATDLPSITGIAANGRDVAIAAGAVIAIVEGDGWTIRTRRTLSGAIGSLDHVARGWLIATERGDGPRLDVAVLDESLATIADHGETDADAPPQMSPDGKWVATRSATTTVIEDRDGREVAQLSHRSRLQSVAWSPASDRLYVGLVDGGVKVWNVDGWRELARIDAHETWIPSIAVAPDGALLFTVGGDGTLRTWDTQQFEQIHTTRVAPDSRIAVPDGVRLIASDRLGFVVRSIDR